MCHVVTAPIDTHYLKSPDFYTVFLTISNYLLGVWSFQRISKNRNSDETQIRLFLLVWDVFYVLKLVFKQFDHEKSLFLAYFLYIF